jgi:hypothetical protein
LLACALILAVVGPPLLSAASKQPPPSSPLAAPARSWAVDCANNEILVVQHPGSYLRYRFHQVTEKGDQLRDQIETPDGTFARLIERDGRPLTPDEDAAERSRLNDLIASPSSFAHHVHREQEGKDMGVRMLKLMPDAMLYSYAPGQPPNPGQATSQPSTDAPLIVLDFKPNPQWSPPDMESEFLTGLEGRVWIDTRSRRIVHLEANIFRAVNIGFGMLAHIYPGGTTILDQTPVPNAPTNGGQPNAPRFIVDHIVEQFTVRALMVKTVKQSLLYDSANIQPIPPMPYQQAIKPLLDTPLPTH